MDAFQHCGQVVSATVARNWDGMSKGFGFVTFADAASAATAARDGGARIDGKLCHARMSIDPATNTASSSRTGGSGGANSGQPIFDVAAARKEVHDFVTRYELSGSVGIALQRADPKAALRAVRSIDSCNQGVSEGLVHVELLKVSASTLSPELEAQVAAWVRFVGLPFEWQDRVRSIVLAQRPEEIEHILEIGTTEHFLLQLRSKENPTTWLLSQVQRFRRDRTLEDIEAFCGRFSFSDQTKQQLSELTSEKARRLMQNWRPVGPGAQRERQDDFLVLLHQATKERKAIVEERNRGDNLRVTAVANHNRIIDEWSDDDGDAAATYVPSSAARARGPREAAEALYAFDAEDREGPPSPRQEGPEQQVDQFLIHSSAGESARSAGTASRTLGSRTSAQRARRRQPKPTHFILCVDTSGSMVIEDCKNASGWPSTRLDAVLETCHQFVAESTMTIEDAYSFVTFNENVVLHFSCHKAFEAQSALERLRPVAEKQTLYSVGMRGVDAAIRRDVQRMPAHVVFLSDGEPTDPKSYLRDLHILRRKHPGENLKIYTVGFGESAKVNASESDFPFLQQLASIGGGHFQRCGASLSSLQGAFTALTTTISQSRSSHTTRRSTGTRDLLTGPSSSHSQNLDMTSEGDQSSLAGTNASMTWPATIREGTSSSSSSGSSGDSEDGEDGKEGVEAAARPVSLGPTGPRADVEFELPNPAQIFRDPRDGRNWKDFMAAQTTFKFDGRTFARRAAVQRVFLRRKPFMQGGMRLVYGMLLEEGAKAPDTVENMMCGKRLFQDLEQDRGFQTHAAFCKSTAVAHFFARLFRAATHTRLGFLDCHLYSPVGQGEDGYHFCGESWLKGHFVKLNSNAGFVNEVDYSEHSTIAQAFSHWTFDHSHGELLVVDLQGICGGEGSDLYFLLTDPQVHSRGAFESFGPGDLGEQGIRAFFRAHTCGELCRRLRLRKEYDLCAPTKVLQMPGTQDGIKHMLGGGSHGKDFFRKLRLKCRISTVTFPREAHSDWLDIRIWASNKGASQAVQKLDERLQEFFNAARATVKVERQPLWDVAHWQRQLQAWRRESGACIIPWPPSWKESQALVEELWVFSTRIHGERYNHKNRNYACQRIQETLQSAPQNNDSAPNLVGSSSGKPEVSQPEEVWQPYLDNSGLKYWYREPDGLWFYETNSQWQRFLDNVNDRHWWWNSETGTWFYEPAVAAG